MAGQFDFELNAGSTFVLEFTWKRNGGIVNLAGFTARAQIREKDVRGRIISELTTENGGIEIEAYAGNVRVIVPAKDTEHLTIPVCVYDVELIGEGGLDVTRILEGRIRVIPNVTRGR